MNIVKKPIITEKMTDQSEKYNRFAFVVDKNANKIEIKKEVEKMYDVVVTSIKTMVCIGKKRVRGTKSGMIVDLLDHVLIGDFELSSLDFLTFLNRVTSK